ncbi:MAG: hypothetical protein UE295_06235 [Acutalibacteraceae bacterium]|nr:hypothetical protein [Acutalibacteraceae bacterium]
MKVQARINFYDIENNNQLRKKGEQFEVSEKRGKYLLGMRAVTEVPATKKTATKKTATSNPTEQQNSTPVK